MYTQVPLEVILLLEKLFESWEAWDQNKNFYLIKLLPDLMENPISGEAKERNIIQRIKGVATEEEWNQLIVIATELPKQHLMIRKATNTIGQFLDQNDIASAWEYANSNGQNAVRRLFEEKKRNYINVAWREIFKALEEWDFHKAGSKYKNIESYLTPSEIEEYKDRLENEKAHKAAVERKRFLKETKAAIIKLLESYDFIGADQKYTQVMEDFPEETYRELVQHYKIQLMKRKATNTIDQFLDQNDIASAWEYANSNGQNAVRRLFEEKKSNYIKVAWRAIFKALGEWDFHKAGSKYKNIESYLTPSEIEEYKDRLENEKAHKATVERKRFLKETKAAIIKLLESYDFIGADQKYIQVMEDFPEETYRELGQHYKIQQEHERFMLSLQEFLEGFNFYAADQLFQRTDFISEYEYKLIKRPYIKNYFQLKHSQEISDEQADSLALPTSYLLISARAGSGKTRVIACKTALLLERFNLNPDQILILAFNKKAATEIRTRIQREYRFESYENARTFHSLAHQLVSPTGELLFDQQDDFSRHKFSLYVQDTLKKVWNPAFHKKMYELFKREMASVERAGALLDDQDYYVYVRNQRDITLGKDHVKSKGEKYIADFLFEHDITYSYERVEFMKGHNYRPDFSLYFEGRDYVIEFWGIDEHDINRGVPAHWDISWDDYHSQMESKREYWRDKKIPLIELSVVDIKLGRVNFEELLKSCLEGVGITCKKLPARELERKVERSQIDRMTELFAQFIQKAKKKMWMVEDVRNNVTEYSTDDEREQVFLDLAIRVYEEYQSRLMKENALDFDDLLLQAADLVHRSQGQADISLGLHKDRRLRMNDLKWILVDEYQDFSALFFNLISAIRLYNPDVQLMCVGDDWQAINSFAGSDLMYFHQFTNLLPGASTATLKTNFRSQEAIVQSSNKLMADLGEPGVALDRHKGGEVCTLEIDDVWIERREEPSYSEEREDDERFIFYELRKDGKKVNDNGFLQTKYLKACYKIITYPENWNKIVAPASKRKANIRVAILSRTNYLYRINLKEFSRKLHSCFEKEEKKQIGDFRKKIHVGTVHSFKGLEADIVIVLRCVEGAFPLIHPDNSLFRIFGQTMQDELDEERRLFYVAITRASEKLYFLTEKSQESSFLKQLGFINSIGYIVNRSLLDDEVDDDDIPF